MFRPESVDMSEAYRVALRYTKNPDKANDLVSDTIAKAWEHKAKFDGRNQRAWLYQLMRNLYINGFRRAKVANSCEIPAWGADAPYEPPDTVAMREIADKVDALPEPYRAVVVLRSHDYAYDEIAAELSVPLGTVMSRLYRARAMLGE